MALRYRLEPLSELQSIARFACGDSEIDSYLHDDALQQMAYGQARTFVEIDTAEPAAIAGFFTLRAHSLLIDADYFDYLADEPEGSTIETPLAELMYLARDLRWRGTGMGPMLMISHQDCFRSG